MIERYSGSFILAAVTTFGLFFIMQALIATGHYVIPDVGPDVVVDVHPHIEDSVTKTKKEELPPPPVVQEEPVMEVFDPVLTKRDGGILIGPKLPPVVIEEGNPTIIPDHNGIPLFRVRPIYPPKALERGIEGYVTMEFDVSKTGLVENIRIVEADPRGIFDSASVKALAQYKYAPKVVDGQAMKQYGLQFRMTFTLDK